MDKAAGSHGFKERKGPRAASLAIGLLLAGLSGAAGVALSAVAAHVPSGGTIEIPARFLLAHAPAFLALGVAGRQAGPVFVFPAFLFMALGLALFCGDLLWRAGQGSGLFAMAAPAGGTLLIVGWATTAFAGLAALIRRG
ncbi:DUF423 domain-containing protein [Stappia sp. F7233]|uniref:DUF423 domain-containing protein n=2 Tax=Stappia albiluteola TaxID=2758565 RepID=A0A839AD97_9HYPH|nr:DUF423 domain-containing protein [Stappia albiluteola]